MTRPSARSLTLDLLSTLKGGSMPVGALVDAGRLMGVAENSVRVAVARLLAAGQIGRDERGRYRLGGGALAIDRRIRGWRHLEQRVRSWDGGWLGIHLGELPAPRRTSLRRREQALRLLGFRVLATGLAVRPDNLLTPLPELRRELHELGLEAGALSFRLQGLDPAEDVRARSLWDVSELCDGYARSIAELAASEQALARLPEPEAMVESFLLGGRVIRQLVLDPLLPEPILPTAERRALGEALARYDLAGRAVWAGFMARHGVERADAPTHTSAATRPPLH